MVPQVADYRGKRGTGKERRVREGKGKATAGSERQINVRRRERGIEEVTGRRDWGKAVWRAQRVGAGDA